MVTYVYEGTASYGTNHGRVAMSPALAKVARAVERRTRAEEGLREARRELEAAIRDAHAAGESYSAIARVVGVTRQRVAQIVEGNDLGRGRGQG